MTTAPSQPKWLAPNKITNLIFVTPPRHLARLCNKPSPLPTFHRAYSLQSQASDCNEMMMTRRAIVGALTFLLAVAATAGAVTFSATNAASSTAGGRRFNRDVGVAYATRVLSDASSFCWKTFSQLSPGGRKPVGAVTVPSPSRTGAAWPSPAATASTSAPSTSAATPVTSGRR